MPPKVTPIRTPMHTGALAAALHGTTRRDDTIRVNSCLCCGRETLAPLIRCCGQSTTSRTYAPAD